MTLILWIWRILFWEAVGSFCVAPGDWIHIFMHLPNETQTDRVRTWNHTESPSSSWTQKATRVTVLTTAPHHAKVCVYQQVHSNGWGWEIRKFKLKRWLTDIIGHLLNLLYMANRFTIVLHIEILPFLWINALILSSITWWNHQLFSGYDNVKLTNIYCSTGMDQECKIQVLFVNKENLIKSSLFQS